MDRLQRCSCSSRFAGCRDGLPLGFQSHLTSAARRDPVGVAGDDRGTAVGCRDGVEVSEVHLCGTVIRGSHGVEVAVVGSSGAAVSRDRGVSTTGVARTRIAVVVGDRRVK